MKKNILTIGAGILMSSAILFTACDKTKEDVENATNNASYTSVQDNSDAEKKYDDIHRIFEKELKDQQNNEAKRVAADCSTITFNATAKTLTIDFGTDGCTDAYGTIRKGKIMVSYTGRYIDSNTVVTTTLDNYYVNGDKIEGTETVTNKGKIDGKVTFEVKVTDGKITYTSGKTATWTSTRTRVLEDEGTILPFDEIYNIYGNASGVDRDGLAYTMTVEKATALNVDMKCWLTTRLPKSGILTVQPQGLETRSIDYGSGDCDRKVKVSIGSFSKEIEL